MGARRGWKVGRRSRVLVALAVLATSVPVGALDGAAAGAAVDDPLNGLGFTVGQPHGGDFPDPHVMRVGSTFYAYSTNTAFRNVPVLRSTDRAHWNYVDDALPAVGAWAQSRHIWAPGVARIGRRYALYYAAPSRRHGKHCIGVATASLPTGPFVSARNPLVCWADRNGSIDPFPFVDDGIPYLLWKTEGVSSRGEPTRLWSQRLTLDGMRLRGRPRELMHTALPWEQPIIENPAMFERGGRYYLLYSAGRWQTSGYATGYAVCRSPMGRCTRLPTAPLLWSWGNEVGTGGASVTDDVDGDALVLYHAWTAPDVGYPSGRRSLRIAEVQVTPSKRLWAKTRRRARY
jgi:beta-xylosidase